MGEHAAATIQLNTAKATLGMMMSDGWAGDFKANFSEITTAKSEAGLCEAKLKKFLAAANS